MPTSESLALCSVYQPLNHTLSLHATHTSNSASPEIARPSLIFNLGVLSPCIDDPRRADLSALPGCHERRHGAPSDTYRQRGDGASSARIAGNSMLYREPLMKALAYASKPSSPGGHLHKGGYAECDPWRPSHQKVADAFETNVPAVNHINNILSTASGSTGLSACTQCTKRADARSAQTLKMTLPDASPEV